MPGVTAAATSSAQQARRPPGEGPLPGHADGSPSGRVTEQGLRRHLLGRRPTDELWGWLGPLLVTVLAGVLRFWHLNRPHQLVFDETYYVKQAYTYLRVGYELRWPEGADDKFTNGAPDVFLTQADFPVHPPVGKWMIAVGEWLFGIDSSWGWRFSAAVVGTLSVLMLARIARRLLGSTLLGAAAGLLLAVDGHHLVHSRTSLLDIFLSFWVLAAFGCLLVDRDRTRKKLARLVATARADGQQLTGVGPRLGLRPWRIATGVCLGLAIGTKWSGLFYLVAFGLMTVLWDVAARRAAGLPRWRLGLLVDGVPAFVSTVPVAAVTYLLSWAGWFASSDAHLRRWGAEHPDAGWGFLPDALRSLAKYHADMWTFHIGLTSDHPYEANPWSWLVQGRPTSFFYESPTRGQAGCLVETCSRAITSVGNPVIWWGGTAAIAVVLFCWLARRDWRAGAILGAIAAGYLPWFYYAAADDRTMYSFYSVVFVPYVVLALTYVLGLVLGPRKAPPDRRLAGAIAAGAVVVAAVVALAWFWPVYVADVIPYSAWRARMWLASWI
jgi:dolichyl-phosphate-mannose--protein O-mannosyl transferase